MTEIQALQTAVGKGKALYRATSRDGKVAHRTSTRDYTHAVEVYLGDDNYWVTERGHDPAFYIMSFHRDADTARNAANRWKDRFTAAVVEAQLITDRRSA